MSKDNEIGREFPVDLESSCYDVVRLRTPEEIYDIFGKTPISEERLNRIFPMLCGVILCNYEDDNNRKIAHVYFDYDKPQGNFAESEKYIYDINLNPQRLWDQLQSNQDGFREKIFTTPLANLINVLPVSVRIDKTIIHPRTRVLIKDISKVKLTEKSKESLIGYDSATNAPETFRIDTMGKVVAHHKDRPIPLEVEWPNGSREFFLGEELRYFYFVE